MHSRFKLLFFTSFLDFLAFSTIIPFVPLFFLPTPHSLLPLDTPLQTRYILLGFLLSTYPLAQVLASPILGHFSDQIGRKKILLLSHLGNSVGYLCSAFAVFYSSIWLLFLGNAIAGLTGGNISTIYSLISDSLPEYKRPKAYGISYAMVGAGFTLGPFIGKLVISHTENLFFLGFWLFLVCTGLSLGNFSLLSFFFKDRKNPIPLLKENSDLSLPDFHPSHFLSCKKETKSTLLSVFLLLFGWYFFIKTFQVFLLEERRFTEENVFLLISMYGLFSLLSQIAYIYKIHQYIKKELFFPFFITLLSISISSLGFVHSMEGTLCLVALFSLGYSALMPSLTSKIAESATEETSGKVMGIYLSVQALAKILAPALAGMCLALTPFSSIGFSSLAIFSSLLFLYKRKRKISLF